MAQLDPSEDFIVNEAGNRAARREQPAARLRANVSQPNSRWSCFAEVAKRRTGNASGWTHERAGPFRGCTSEAAIAMRTAFIENYFVTRQLTFGKRPLPPPRDSETQGRRKAARDASAATAELLRPNPWNGEARSGPGRGKKAEAAAHQPRRVDESVADECEPPVPEAAATGNWLQRLTLQKEWQSSVITRLKERILELERKLAQSEALIGQQAQTIQQFRKRVSRLLLSMRVRLNAFTLLLVME